MILRIVRGTVADPAHNPDAWVMDTLGRLRGGGAKPRATFVGWRPTTDGVTVAVVTAWKDAATAASYEADVRLLEAAGHRPEPVLYECESGGTTGSVARPSVLRIATGWIERGPDAEIQQELRARLPRLGSELVDAYVGRRIRGQSVEVLLVATWTKEPSDHPLDEPLWPDITARYREFLIETYAPVASG